MSRCTGTPRKTVHHLDSEGRGRTAVVRFGRKEAKGLFEEGVERFFGREIRLVARNRGPEQRRHVHRIVMRRTAHQGKLGPGLVADALEFPRLFRPRQHIAMTAYREQALVVRLVQKGVDPLLVERIGPAVTGQGVHVAGRPLETAEGLVRIVQKHELVIDMIASEQQPYRCGEREPTVRPIGGKPFVADVRIDALRQIVQIAQRMQAEAFVAHAHLSRIEAHVFEYGPRAPAQGQVAAEKARTLRSSCDLVGREPLQTEQTALGQNADGLTDGVEKTGYGFRVADLFGNEESPAERREVAPGTHPLARGLRNEKIAVVVQIGTFEKVPFEAARKKALRHVVRLRAVTLPDEPVLLVYDGVRRQNLQRLDPAGVHRLVFGGRDRKELRERYPEGDRNVGLLAEDAPLLDGEDREFALQCCGFQYASHRKSGN